MILDYSQPAVRRSSPGRWIRALWSHQARMELGFNLTCGQALALVIGISLLAGALSTTHACVRCLLPHLRHPLHISIPAIRHDLAVAWLSTATNALKVAPICFCIIMGSLILLSNAWARRGGRFSRAFPVFSAGSVPLLWFFVLFQIEGLAGLSSARSVLYEGMWNPVTSTARFILLMTGAVLLALWISDAARVYTSLRQRDAG